MSGGTFARRSLFSPGIWLLLTALALLWLALRTITPRDIWQVALGVRTELLFLLVLLNGLIIAALNSRWWLFMQMQGYPLPFGALLRYRIAGFGVSYFTPGPHAGGEPVQILLVHRRHHVPGDVAVAAVALDKTFDMFFNFAFLVGSLWLALHNGIFTSRIGQGSLAYAALWLLVPVGLFGAYRRGVRPFSYLVQSVAVALARLGDLFPQPFRVLRTPRAAESLRRFTVDSESRLMALCQRDAGQLLNALFLSAGIWVLLIAEFWLATRAVGLNLTVMQATVVMAAARVAILLPMPAGLGALEASLVLAMQALGLDAAAGIALSLLIRARDVSVGLVGLWFASRDLALAQFFSYGVRKRLRRA